MQSSCVCRVLRCFLVVPSQRFNMFKDIAEQENLVLFKFTMSNTGMHESKTKTGIIADDRQCAKSLRTKVSSIYWKWRSLLRPLFSTTTHVFYHVFNFSIVFGWCLSLKHIAVIAGVRESVTSKDGFDTSYLADNRQ